MGAPTNTGAEASNTTLAPGDAPSLVDYKEKKVDDSSSTSGNETDNGTIVAGTGGAGEEDIEYPKGVALTFIIVALVLSIFLVALDMVSFRPIFWQQRSDQLTPPNRQS